MCRPASPAACRYKKGDNAFYIFADDAVPRHVTATLHLDYDTVAGADRFGNVFVSRLPPEVSAQVEDDPTGGKYAAETGVLGGAPNKLQTVSNFHVSQRWGRWGASGGASGVDAGGCLAGILGLLVAC